MSAVLETSTNPPPPRPRCTHVRARIDATALSVRIADNVCMAEFATLSGLVQVVLPADRFVSATRGPVDGNGRPFPPVREDSSERSLRVLEADAEVVPIVRRPRGPRRLPATEAAFEAAWAQLQARPALTIVQAATEQGISRERLRWWILTYKPDAWRTLKRTRRQLRPKGVAS